MNQENTSYPKNCTATSKRDQSSEKGIYYGLIILIELAENYYLGGCDLTYISKKYDFQLCDLIPVVNRLKEAALLDCREDNAEWLFVKKEPHGEWILEVVSTLKDIFYPKKK